MKASFQNSVSVLVLAYMRGTLEHSTCQACAVTQLCDGWQGWACLFVTTSCEADRFEGGWRRYGFEQNIRATPNASDLARIRKSGYSLDDLKRIEWAFETAPQGSSYDDWMFNGLMAVVDVLADIHQIDLSTKEAAIGQFKEVQLSKV